MTQPPLPGVDNPNFFLPGRNLSAFVTSVREQENYETRRLVANSQIDFYREAAAKTYREAEIENMQTTLRRTRAILSTLPTDAIQIRTPTISLDAPDCTRELDGEQPQTPMFCAEFGSFVKQDGELVQFSVNLVPLLFGKRFSNDPHVQEFEKYRGLLNKGEHYTEPRQEEHRDIWSRVGSIALPRTGIFSKQLHAVPLSPALDALYQEQLSFVNAFYVESCVSMPNGEHMTLLGNAVIGDRDTQHPYARPWGNVSFDYSDFLVTQDEWAEQEASGELSGNLLAFMELGLPNRREDYFFVNDALAMIEAGRLTPTFGDGALPNRYINSAHLGNAVRRVQTFACGVESSGGNISDKLAYTRNFAVLSQLK